MTTSIILGKSTYTVDFGALPQTSQDYLIHKALAHLLGNVIAAKITAATTKATADGTPLDDAAKSALTEQYRQDTLKRLAEGTIATRATSPRKSDEDRWADEIATDMIKRAAAAYDKPIPKDKAEFAKLLAAVKLAKAKDIAKDVAARAKARDQHNNDDILAGLI